MELIRLFGRALSHRWWGALAFAPHPTWRRAITALRTRCHSARRRDAAVRISDQSRGVGRLLAVDASPLRVDALPVQGRLGDCWVMAPLLSIALHSLAFIESGLRQLPNGQVQVRLFDRSQPVTVTVDRALPAICDPESGRVLRWELARTCDDAPGWAGIVEKAVALHVAGSYRGIERGLATFGIPLLTGIPSHLYVMRFPNARRICERVAAGHVVVASTHPLSPRVMVNGEPLPANHVMAVAGADTETGQVFLRNPWRPERLMRLTRSQFRRGFLSMDVSIRPLPS